MKKLSVGFMRLFFFEVWLDGYLFSILCWLIKIKGGFLPLLGFFEMYWHVCMTGCMNVGETKGVCKNSDPYIPLFSRYPYIVGFVRFACNKNHKIVLLLKT